MKPIPSARLMRVRHLQCDGWQDHPRTIYLPRCSRSSAASASCSCPPSRPSPRRRPVAHQHTGTDLSTCAASRTPPTFGHDPSPGRPGQSIQQLLPRSFLSHTHSRSPDTAETELRRRRAETLALLWSPSPDFHCSRLSALSQSQPCLVHKLLQSAESASHPGLGRRKRWPWS